MGKDRRPNALILVCIFLFVLGWWVGKVGKVGGWWGGKVEKVGG